VWLLQLEVGGNAAALMKTLACPKIRRGIFEKFNLGD
jgi:hypothetical protein